MRKQLMSQQPQEKTAIENDLRRKNSNGNLRISKSGVEVLPRYLCAPVGSCHDFCKYELKHILENERRRLSEIENNLTRKNPNGNSRVSKSGIEVPPRYLCASMGSCHDSCKYELKHILENKERRPLRKSPTPKGITARSSRGQSQAKDVEIQEKKKKSGISPRPLSSSRNLKRDKCQIIRKETVVSPMKTTLSLRHFASPHDRVDVSEGQADDPRPKTLQTKPHSLSTRGHLSSRRYSEILPPKGIEIVRVNSERASSRHSDIRTSKETSRRDRVDVSAEHADDLRPKTLQTKPHSLSTRGHLSSRRYSEILPPKGIEIVRVNSVRASSRHSDIRTSKETSRRDRVDVSAEHADDLRSKTLQTKPYSLSTRGHLSSRRYSEILPRKGIESVRVSSVRVSSRRRVIRTSKEMSSPKFRKKNDLLPPKSGQYNDPKQMSHLKIRNSVRKVEPKQQSVDENVPERIHYMIDTKPENRIRRDNQNEGDTTHSSQCASPSSEDKSSECHQQGIHTSESPRSTGSKKLRHTQNAFRITRSSASESMRSDVQSKNTRPRRLRFKKRRVLSESHSSQANRKIAMWGSLKKVDVINDLNGSETRPANVVLRHQVQDVEGKKGGQSLFNNMIEETASKLSQSRKSKVKALVGAFETLITFQDTKSS